jgi:CheY-like chemotaxis protein
MNASTEPNSLSQATHTPAAAESLASQMGFQSRICRDGQSAVAEIKEWHPNVILSDSVLEDMQVTEFAQQARTALGDRPAIIIAWSSSPELQDTLLAPDTGIDDFILKSPDMEQDSQLTATLLGAIR